MPVEKCPTCGNVMASQDMGPIVIDEACKTATWIDQPLRLSRREFNVLKAIMQAGGQPVAAATIHHKVFTVNSAIGNVTVTVGNLRRAFLRVDPKFDRLQTMNGRGYYWRCG